MTELVTLKSVTKLFLGQPWLHKVCNKKAIKGRARMSTDIISSMAVKKIIRGIIEVTFIYFRSLLLKACHSKNKERILEGASGVKCSHLKDGKYGRQSYLQDQTISQCRNWFRTRFGLRDFAGNYSHNRKFSKTNWMCRCSKEVEEEGHIVS